VGGRCSNCDGRTIYKRATYTPDFLLPNGLFVESKGKFTSKDRKIAMAMLKQWPKVKYRMLFMRDNKLSKNSNTRYSDWCNQNGVKYAIGLVPKEWTE